MEQVRAYFAVGRGTAVLQHRTASLGRLVGGQAAEAQPSAVLTAVHGAVGRHRVRAHSNCTSDVAGVSLWDEKGNMQLTDGEKKRGTELNLPASLTLRTAVPRSSGQSGPLTSILIPRAADRRSPSKTHAGCRWVLTSQLASRGSDLPFPDCREEGRVQPRQAGLEARNLLAAQVGQVPASSITSRRDRPGAYPASLEAGKIALAQLTN